MTYEELLTKIDWYDPYHCGELQNALRAVVQFHHNFQGMCMGCRSLTDDLCVTLEIIQKELV